MNVLQLTKDELMGEPEARTLVMNKSIMSFNVKITEKTANLNTGNKFDYDNVLYEIMNRESVDAPINYIKLNCVKKASNPV